MPGYGFWQGAERATGQMAATGMQLLNFQANQRIQGERTAMLREQADREKIAFENQEKKRIEQETIDNAIMPASLANPRFHESPRVTKQYVETLRSMGFNIEQTGDEVYGPKKAFDALRQVMNLRSGNLKSDLEVVGTNAALRRADLQDQASSLAKQIQELTESGKDDEKTAETIAKLTAKKLAVGKQVAETYTLDQKVQEALAIAAGEQPGKEALKQMELEAKGEKSQTEEQLTARALRGDEEAKAILGAMQKRKADIASLREGGTRERADRQFAVTLRKEFNALPEVEEYNQTMPKIKSMQAAFESSKTTKNFVAVDQALITLYNKLTDPTSVVRESEYARTAENIPLINQIRGKAEKVLKGGAGLTGEERKALMDMAMLMQKGYEEIRARRLNEYRGYGVQGGLTPEFLSDATGSMTAPKKVGRFVVEVE